MCLHDTGADELHEAAQTEGTHHDQHDLRHHEYRAMSEHVHTFLLTTRWKDYLSAGLYNIICIL